MKVTKIGDAITVTQGKYDTVFVTRPSLISNKYHTVSFGGVRYEDIVQYLEERYHRKPGLMVDEMFPQLNANEREFLMTGITEEEWKMHMKGEDE